jgi:predicted nucleic acid-binding protein
MVRKAIPGSIDRPAADASARYAHRSGPARGARRHRRSGADRLGHGVSRQSLFISALILHELESEAVHVARQDKAAGAIWRAWIDDQVMQAFNGRVLSIDTPVVRRAAQLGYEDQRDGLLAATALEHGFTLVTLRLAPFGTGGSGCSIRWAMSQQPRSTTGGRPQGLARRGSKPVRAQLNRVEGRAWRANARS